MQPPPCSLTLLSPLSTNPTKGLIFPKKRTTRDALRDVPAAAAGNGPLLRLQSAHFTPRPVDQAGTAPPGGRGLVGGFFDITKMRWRSGNSVTGGVTSELAGKQPSGIGGSTNSLKWLLRGDVIAEGGEDVEAGDAAGDAKKLDGSGDAQADGGVTGLRISAAAGGDSEEAASSEGNAAGGVAAADEQAPAGADESGAAVGKGKKKGRR